MRTPPRLLRLGGSCRASGWVTCGSSVAVGRAAGRSCPGLLPPPLGRAPRFGRGGGGRGGFRRSSGGFVGVGRFYFNFPLRSGRRSAWVTTMYEVIFINFVTTITPGQADEIYRRLPSRSKLIFAIGIETGLRISDILRLRNCDVENPLRVYVSRTGRVIPYPISDWLHNELISACSLQDTYIFTSQRKWQRPLHRTTYHRDLKRAVEDLNYSCSAHSTRKLFLGA